MKFAILVFIFAVSSSLNAFSQAPAKEWDYRFGGTAVDEIFSVQQTSDGGYILGGSTSSGLNGDKSQASQGGKDYWMVKISSSGIKEWDKRFGGSEDDELRAVQQTIDGGYILGGFSYSGIGGDKSQSCWGQDDYWMVKTDSVGNKEWDARFGGNDYDELYALQQTSDSGFILGGFSYSGGSGDKSQNSRGQDDYWMVKTDVNGNKLWDARFGGNSYDDFTSLQQTTDGGYILAGSSLSKISGDKSQDKKGVFDYWMVKTDAEGVKQWDADFGGDSFDYCQSVLETVDGGYLLGGSSLSDISGDKTQPGWGAHDFWIVKTDGSGTKQWDLRYGGSETDWLNAMRQTTDKGYILAGYSSSEVSGDKTQTSQGHDDFWMVKIDSNGVKEWDERFGGSEYDNAFDVIQSDDGGYLVGGLSVSGISGDKTQDNWDPLHSTDDFWIVKLEGVATGIENSSSPNTSLTFFPNPVSSTAIISFLLHEDSHVMIELISLDGRKVMTLADENYKWGNHSITFNPRNLSRGLYLLQLKSSQENQQTKILIQ